MGKLADAIEASGDRRGGVECSLGRVLRTMSDEDRVDLVMYLRDLDVSATRIATVLGHMKYPVNVHAVRKHRNRLLRRAGSSCRCDLTEAEQDGE